MKLLSKKAVREKVGVSFAQIDRWEKDAEYAHLEFPARTRIGFKVFWSDEEIDDFIRRQLERREAPAQ
jgi:prophage regulatory protein